MRKAPKGNAEQAARRILYRRAATLKDYRDATEAWLDEADTLNGKDLK